MPVSVDPQRLKLTDESGAQGTLVGFQCKDCRVTVFGPATFCQSCTSSDLESVELESRGTLFSYTIVRIPPAGWPGPVPYILGQVALPEGPHVLAEIVDCEESVLQLDMPMELAFQVVKSQESEAEKIVYKWRPSLP